MASSRSEISEENKARGLWYQDLAAEFFSQLLKEKPIENNLSKGIDLIFKTAKIEVKGIGGLSQLNNRVKTSFTSRRWKIDKSTVKKDVTHFAFVLFDEDIVPKPIILTVHARYVFEFLKIHRSSETVWIPLGWIKENFSPTLSQLPEVLKLKYKHTNNIPELSKPALKGFLTEVFQQKNYSFEELVFLGDFFEQFMLSSWWTNPIIEQFNESIYKESQRLIEKGIHRDLLCERCKKQLHVVVCPDCDRFICEQCVEDCCEELETVIQEVPKCTGFQYLIKTLSSISIRIQSYFSNN